MKSFQEMNPDHLVGQSPFVAAFASTNLGDVSPNTDGPKCQDTGLPCDIEHSTCDGRFDGLLLGTVTIIFDPGPKCVSPLVLAKTCLSQPRSLLSASTGKKTAQKTRRPRRHSKIAEWPENCCWSQQRKLKWKDPCSSSTSGLTCHRYCQLSSVRYSTCHIGSCDSCKRVDLTYLPPCPWIQLCSRNH